MSEPITDLAAEDRFLALRLAVDLHSKGFDSRAYGANAAVVETAATLYRFLDRSTTFFLIVGPVLAQSTGLPTGNTTKGSPMQLHDDEKVDLTVAETDAKGFPVSDDPNSTTDDVTWFVDDESVASLQVSSDTRTATVLAGSVGSAVVTVTAGTLTATVAVDVIAGGATVLTVTAGTPVPQ